MLAEVAHFLWNAPAALLLKARLSQEELYEEVMRRADGNGLSDKRRALVSDLRGEILEIGAGTGRMFPHYHPSATVQALEPDTNFARISQIAAQTAGARVVLHPGRGETLPFEDRRFDAVVMALLLCTVESPHLVVREARRVLKKGGTLRLLEHVRSPNKVAGWMMDQVNGIWLSLNAQGCNLNRDPLPILTQAGFEVASVEAFQIFSPGIPAFPMRRIEAFA